ncbi:lysoplasmalogenase [Robertkochia sediminum]|uniref:lysoplasmalogenase n=1 Tax=Robertkochia sediminum TaxID=2785326 RepID=UPI001933813F|nr:lysoplasmalogenase [Robertkochia sediminum]MBL7473644.1 lysoplasmalogenase [Robertkochia sediminum]
MNHNVPYISRSENHINWLPFTLIYTVITAADIAVLSMDLPHVYREITKPLILIALMIFFVWKAFPLKNRRSWLFLGGLFFSFLGDGFLNYEGYFLPGLLAFFTAHVCYIAAFSMRKGFRQIWKTPIPYLTLSYAIGVFLWLEPHLGALKPYVVLYMIILVALVIALLSRKAMVSPSAYIIGLVGGYLFLLSDSLLAINKFAAPFFLAPQAIMITYALAQFLLLKSFLTSRP